MEGKLRRAQHRLSPLLMRCFVRFMGLFDNFPFWFRKPLLYPTELPPLLRNV